MQILFPSLILVLQSHRLLESIPRPEMTSFMSSFMTGMFDIYTGNNDHIQSTREYNGVIHAFKKIFQNEGFVGFFKGYPVSMFSMPATFLYLTTLEVNFNRNVIG